MVALVKPLVHTLVWWGLAILMGMISRPDIAVNRRLFWSPPKADAYDLTQLQTPVCEHCPAPGLKRAKRAECDPLTALAVAISYQWEIGIHGFHTANMQEPQFSWHVKVKLMCSHRVHLFCSPSGLTEKVHKPTKFWGVCPVLSMFCGVNPPRTDNLTFLNFWNHRKEKLKRTKAVQRVRRLTSLGSQLAFLSSWVDHLILGERFFFTSFLINILSQIVWAMLNQYLFQGMMGCPNGGDVERGWWQHLIHPDTFSSVSEIMQGVETKG